MDASAQATARRRRVVELLGSCSIELTPRDEFAGKALADLFDAGMTVFVSHPPSVTHQDIVAACVRLQRAGFTAVPHVAVRRLASFAEASDLLRRVSEEAEVDRILLIGGDSASAGPFRAALDLLATGVIERHGISHVAFAGYPEGHASIDARSLDAALQAKVALAHQRGLDVSLVTQFGFEATPILGWIELLRAQGIHCPVRVGVAGPASVTTLAKFAVRCGIGASLRALARGHTAFARIVTEASPDALIAELVAGEDGAIRIEGLHVFAFGGARRTAKWLRAARGDAA